jgi:hypothetical protein
MNDYTDEMLRQIADDLQSPDLCEPILATTDQVFVHETQAFCGLDVAVDRQLGMRSCRSAVNL